MKIEKSAEIGFCFGVRRAIDIVARVARERGGLETLGAVVHNQQVLQDLADLGVVVAKSVDDIQGDAVVISAHGANPRLEQALDARHISIINTTCPFVHRAQMAARRLASAGFFVVVYGEADHPEVKGILGWAGDGGVAALNENFISRLKPLPRRLGILSQTTQIPANFTEFIKKLIDTTFTKDSEIRIIDTICHDIRKRQEAALELAGKVDLMLVIGGRDSANTNRLAELCATVTETHFIETAADIQPAWLEGRQHIGITAGASTSEQTVNEVAARLQSLS
jgi:4-hydroxy-3-methylbut-2-enyl diphosphate reductase